MRGRAVGDAHRRYSRKVNFREGWRGHLFQGRFASFVMDEPWLLAAARYVELNPVRAGLVDKAWQWKWSSAAAHRRGRDDKLVSVGPLLEMAGKWTAFLRPWPTEEETQALRQHERTGRPLGSEGFVERIEGLLDRLLRPMKRGPKAEKIRKRRN